MKLDDFPMVEALVSTRNHLIGQRDEGRISIEIDGRQQTHDLVEAVTPAIKLELRHRIADINDRLRELGVVLD